MRARERERVSVCVCVCVRVCMHACVYILCECTWSVSEFHVISQQFWECVCIGKYILCNFAAAFNLRMYVVCMDVKCVHIHVPTCFLNAYMCAFRRKTYKFGPSTLQTKALYLKLFVSAASGLKQRKDDLHSLSELQSSPTTAPTLKFLSKRSWDLQVNRSTPSL